MIAMAGNKCDMENLQNVTKRVSCPRLFSAVIEVSSTLFVQCCYRGEQHSLCAVLL